MTEEGASPRGGRVVFNFGIAACLVVGAVVVGIAVELITAQRTFSGSAPRTSCLSNVRQIQLAMIQYAGDYNDEFPSALTDDNEPAQRRFERLLTLNYLNAPKVFHCPSSTYTVAPDVLKLEGKTLTDSSLKPGTVASVYLTIDWCSYGLDPKVNHTMSAGRAVVADRPDPEYWGATAGSPGSGPQSNSDNHKHSGQNVAYNDGHVKWMPTVHDDQGIDPNIFSVNPEVPTGEDSNIRYGSGPNTP